MRKKIILSLAAAPLAVAGIATATNLSFQKDSHAYDDELLAIGAPRNLSIDETKASLGSHKLLVEMEDESKFDELGIENYKNLISKYYIVRFNSLEDTIEGYKTLEGVANHLSINYPTVSATDDSYELHKAAIPGGTYTWYGTQTVGIDNFVGGDNYVIAGIIDDGFNVNHSVFDNKLRLDLTSETTVNGNFAGTEFGHGTATAGVLAGGTSGNVGIAPIPVSEEGSLGILEGLQYLNDVVGARVASLSLGWYMDEMSAEDLELTESVMEAFKNSGMIIVGAIGNDNSSVKVLYPSASEHSICVGATNESDEVTEFSSYGPTVDFVAPGDNVIAAKASTNTEYEISGGTSFSAPLTAAAIADVLTVNNTLTYDGVYQYLVDNAKDLYWGGRDDTSGYGRVYINNATISNNYEHYHVDPDAITITLGDLSDDGDTIDISATSNTGKKIVAYQFFGGIDVENMPTKYIAVDTPASSIESPFDVSAAGGYTIWFVDEDGAVMGAGFESSGHHDVIKDEPPHIGEVRLTIDGCKNDELCTVTIDADITDDNGISKISYYVGDSENSLQTIDGNTFTGHDGDVKFWKIVATDTAGHDAETNINRYEIKSEKTSSADTGDNSGDNSGTGSDDKPSPNPGTGDNSGDNSGTDSDNKPSPNPTPGNNSSDSSNGNSNNNSSDSSNNNSSTNSNIAKDSSSSSQKSASNPNTGSKKLVYVPAAAVFGIIGYALIAKRFKR